MAEAAVQSAEVKQESLVLARRKITIEREVGFWAILVFAFSSIGLAYGGLLPFSTLAGLWPGANLAISIIIGAAFFLVYAFTFAAIGTLAPRFGADYVVASRVINPALAFVSSWILVLCLALWGGGLVAWIGKSVVPMFAQALSMILYDKTLLNIADWAASPSGMIILGTLGVVLIFLMMIFPPRVTHLVLLVGVVLTVAAWALIGYLFASAAPGALQSSWDQFMGEGSFLDQVMKARSLGLKLNLDSGALVTAGMMASLWLFFGGCTPTCFAREIKEPKKNLLAGTWLGLAASVIGLVLVTVLVQRLVPLEWLAAESFLSRSASEPAMPWLPFYALLLRPNAILVYLLGFAWIYALLTLAHTLLYAASRTILAWGEDHLIPESAMFLHPELRSPLIAVLLVCLLAEAAVVWAALGPQYFYQVNPVFYIAAAQFLPVLGITLLPFLKRDWFARAEGFTRIKIGPLPLISITGALSLLYLAWMFLWPGSGLGMSLIGWETGLGFAIAVVTGLAWFFSWRYSLRKQGKDVDGMLRSVPED